MLALSAIGALSLQGCQSPLDKPTVGLQSIVVDQYSRHHVGDLRPARLKFGSAGDKIEMHEIRFALGQTRIVQRHTLYRRRFIIIYFQNLRTPMPINGDTLFPSPPLPGVLRSGRMIHFTAKSERWRRARASGIALDLRQGLSVQVVTDTQAPVSGQKSEVATEA